MPSVETLKVKNAKHLNDNLKIDYLIINLSDYDPGIHTPYDTDEEIKAARNAREWQSKLQSLKPKIEAETEKQDMAASTEYAPSFEVAWDQIVEDDNFVANCEARGLDPQLCVYSADELREYAADKFYTWIRKATEFDDIVRQVMIMEDAAEEVYEIDDAVEDDEDEQLININVDDFEWEIIEDIENMVEE